MGWIMLLPLAQEDADSGYVNAQMFFTAALWMLFDIITTQQPASMAVALLCSIPLLFFYQPVDILSFILLAGYFVPAGVPVLAVAWFVVHTVNCRSRDITSAPALPTLIITFIILLLGVNVYAI